jgi:AcrR family transcriptional regulator
VKARDAAAARTRGGIVRAACAVYARVGFRRASIQAIAREAEVSPVSRSIRPAARSAAGARS